MTVADSGERDAQLADVGPAAPSVRVLRYCATPREAIQAFADIEVDGWLQVNGLHLLRDGTIRSAQLTPLIRGKRCFIDAVEIVDPDLRASLTAAILAAIGEHVESLPLEQRLKPPRPPEPRREEQPPAIAPIKPAESAAEGRLLKINAKPPVGKPKLPPPARLLARRD